MTVLVQAQRLLDRLDDRAQDQVGERFADHPAAVAMIGAYTHEAARAERLMISGGPGIIRSLRSCHRILAVHKAELAELARIATGCCCPLVWNGHGDPKPDPKRVDPECPVHGEELPQSR